MTYLSYKISTNFGPYLFQGFTNQAQEMTIMPAENVIIPQTNFTLWIFVHRHGLRLIQTNFCIQNSVNFTPNAMQSCTQLNISWALPNHKLFCHRLLREWDINRLGYGAAGLRYFVPPSKCFPPHDWDGRGKRFHFRLAGRSSQLLASIGPVVLLTG